jgi:hypothetical protein
MVTKTQILQILSTNDSQSPAEGLVQERLLQGLQRGELPLVEAGEALGFFVEGVDFFDDGLLPVEWRQIESEIAKSVLLKLGITAPPAIFSSLILQLSERKNLTR